MILRPDAVHKHYRVRWREGTTLRQETCASYDDATILDAKKKVARDQAAPPIMQPNIRLGEYADQWLRQIDVQPKTRVSYTESLKTYILPVLGKFKVRQIHREHIRRLLAGATKRDKTTPLSQNSRRLIRATLSVLLGDAVEEGIIPSNPVIGLARKGRKRQVGTVSPADRQRSIRPLSYEQLALVLRAAQRAALPHARRYWPAPQRSTRVAVAGPGHDRADNPRRTCGDVRRPAQGHEDRGESNRRPLHAAG